MAQQGPSAAEEIGHAGQVHQRTVEQTLHALPIAFKQWVLEQTRQQIAALQRFAALTESEHDAPTAAALQSAERLGDELEEATAKTMAMNVSGSSRIAQADSAAGHTPEEPRCRYVVMLGSFSSARTRLDVAPAATFVESWPSRGEPNIGPHQGGAYDGFALDVGLSSRGEYRDWCEDAGAAWDLARWIGQPSPAAGCRDWDRLDYLPVLAAALAHDAAFGRQTPSGLGDVQDELAHLNYWVEQEDAGAMHSLTPLVEGMPFGRAATLLLCLYADEIVMGTRSLGDHGYNVGASGDARADRRRWGMRLRRWLSHWPRYRVLFRIERELRDLVGASASGAHADRNTGYITHRHLRLHPPICERCESAIDDRDSVAFHNAAVYRFHRGMQALNASPRLLLEPSAHALTLPGERAVGEEQRTYAPEELLEQRGQELCAAPWAV